MRAGPAVLVVIALGAACTDDSATTPRSPELGASRSTTYGASDGEGALSGVFDVDVDADGSVYVSEPSFARVVVFRPDGSFHATIGARGQGPGEFQFPGNLTWRGDTLAVLEFQRGISLFRRDGDFVGKISFALRGPNPRFAVGPTAPLSDGTVASFVPTLGEDVVQGRVEREAWLKMSRDGELLDTLAWRRVVGDYFSYERDGRVRTPSHPLATGDLLALPPDGSSFVLASRQPPESGETATFTLMRLDLSGDTISSVDVPYDPVEVTAEDRAALVGSMISVEEGDEGFEARVRAVESAMEWPRYFPAFDTALAGRDGSVWVKRHLQRDGARRWDLFDADFETLGHVYLPEEIEVKLVSRDFVYGVELDELDVPWVVRFEISQDPVG